MSASLVWFRRDLRLEDNPALQAAIERDQPIVPLFIWAPEEETPWQPGSASRWWLHHSLTSLQSDLQERGARLVLRSGDSLDVLNELIDSYGVDAIYWNRLYDPAIIARDKNIKQELIDSGIDVRSFNGSLLAEPWEISTKQDRPYQVFTPFWKSLSASLNLPETVPAPSRIPTPQKQITSEDLDSWELLPKLDWADPFHDHWKPGSEGGNHELERFLNEAAADYHKDRNRPDRMGSSRLSPYLHFGEISVREVFQRVQEQTPKRGEARKSFETYLRELGWREFAHHLLYHFPQTVSEPLRENFRKFPWEKDANALRRWQKGITGYPFVDAGMRELWKTGWMHNRVRMVVASFLTKDLRISWKAGADWFWDTLVDADLANNTLGWQWTAGCGADAAPYFRVFNPTSQASRYDPDGNYIRQYVPEISELEGKSLYEPWNASDEELARAECELGADYPEPMIDHAEAREIALSAYETIKTGD